MGFAVGIPWIETPCPYRQASFEFAKEWWDRAGFEVVIGRGESRSAARNDAARQVFERHEVVVLADADTVCPARQVTDAAKLAERLDRYVLAYTEHVRLGRRALPPPDREFRTFTGAAAGIAAISKKLWKVTGGYDCRFETWGGEDRAYLAACNVLRGAHERIEGPSWHIWHPGNRGYADDQRALSKRYQTITDRAEMLALLGEPGGPLDG